MTGGRCRSTELRGIGRRSPAAQHPFFGLHSDGGPLDHAQGWERHEPPADDDSTSDRAEHDD